MTGYNKVTVSFAGTQIPNRRLKIAEVDFGSFVVWGKTKPKLISANVLEEVDITSNELTIDTLDFSVHDEDSDFNMLNPRGVYTALQEKQELEVVEYLDGTPIKMGKYYLDTWENKSPTVADFSAYSVVGLFDKVEYKTSAWWAGTTASVVFADIFAAAGFTKYTIEAIVATELVYGCLPIMSVREALQTLCFSLRAACITARDGSVQIVRLPTAAAPQMIEKGQKLGAPKVSQTAVVNSVLVTSHTFTAGQSQQLYKDTLAPGTYEVTFDSATSLTVTGATIIGSGVNYAKISVATQGIVTITGLPLQDNTRTHLYESPGLSTATRSQVKVEDIPLISTCNADAVAQFLHADYQRRIVQSFKLQVVDEAVGDNLDVDTMLNARKTGVITKMSIDLTGGFLADCEVRG